MKEDENGWWDVPALKKWICPNCKVKSAAELWSKCEPYCSDCGNHDGRKCPNCGDEFDHVWGARDIANANLKAGGSDA